MPAYSDQQRLDTLAALQANGGNVAKTERQTGIPRLTIRKWRDTPELLNHPEVAAVKEQFEASYKQKVTTAREFFLDRMVVLAAAETDLHKVTGAFKIAAEAAAEAETQAALAAAIRKHAGELN